MKVTVCELNNDQAEFKKDWESLKEYLSNEPSDLLLLPEMPFSEWVAYLPEVNQELKEATVQEHEEWLVRLEELDVPKVVYSRPVINGSLYHNTAFIWTKELGHQKIHTKQYFPEEDHFWEGTWYDKDTKGFNLIEVDGLKVGVLLCTEVWFTQHARDYGIEGIDLLLCPRATGLSSVDQWVRCGQTLAVISGGFCLSSNRTGSGKENFQWGGAGWVAQPMDGELLGVTNSTAKFLTVKIDLSKSEAANKEYPLYVKTS